MGLAHFDPSYFIYENLDILISLLKENNIYFEFNSRYPEYYSRKNELFFEELRKANVPVAMGCDSHNITSLSDIEELEEMIFYYNLEDNYQNLVSQIINKSQC